MIEMNILLIYPILIQRSWVYNDQVSAGQGRPISVSKMKLFKFLNIDFELDSSAESADEDEPDQRRPFGFKRLTGWSPEPTVREPAEPDFLDELLADGIPGFSSWRSNMGCVYL